MKKGTQLGNGLHWVLKGTSQTAVLSRPILYVSCFSCDGNVNFGISWKGKRANYPFGGDLLEDYANRGPLRVKNMKTR